MGMYVGVRGIKEADEKYYKFKKIYELCEETKIEIHSEIEDYFWGSEPHKLGIYQEVIKEEYSSDNESGIRVYIDKLDKDIKILEFYIS